MTVYQIVYSSLANGILRSDKQLQELLRQARASNHQLRITGILLYNNGNIVQVLEGEKQAVQALYRKICQDSRHNHVSTLKDGPVERRVFPDWSMGFATLDADKFAQLTGYVDPHKPNFLLPRAHNASPELLALIQEFVAAS